MEIDGEVVLDIYGVQVPVILFLLAYLEFGKKEYFYSRILLWIDQVVGSEIIQIVFIFVLDHYILVVVGRQIHIGLGIMVVVHSFL